MDSALRPLVMQSRGPLTTTIVAFGDLLREIIPILLEMGAGVQVGFFRAVCDSCKVADAEVDTRRLGAGRVRSLHFMVAHEVEFPLLV